MPLCGGTSEAKEATEEIQALIDQVRADLEEKVGHNFPHYEAVAYKSQVVAGTNFFVKIRVDGDKFVHARIFKALPHAGGTVSLHSHKTDKTKEDGLEYF